MNIIEKRLFCVHFRFGIRIKNVFGRDFVVLGIIDHKAVVGRFGLFYILHPVRF